MKRGFTLIETLIYLTLFTIVLGGLVTSAYALFESNGRNQTHAMLQEEQDFLIAKINRALDGAKEVSIVDPTTLVVTQFSGSILTIELSGTDLTHNGSILNNSNVAISDLVFTHTTSAGSRAPESVSAAFTIRAHTPHGGILAESASTTRDRKSVV